MVPDRPDLRFSLMVMVDSALQMETLANGCYEIRNANDSHLAVLPDNDDRSNIVTRRIGLYDGQLVGSEARSV